MVLKLNIEVSISENLLVLQSIALCLLVKVSQSFNFSINGINFGLYTSGRTICLFHISQRFFHFLQHIFFLSNVFHETRKPIGCILGSFSISKNTFELFFGGLYSLICLIEHREVTGRRSSGYFALKKYDGTAVSNSASYKKLTLLETATNYITERS